MKGLLRSVFSRAAPGALSRADPGAFQRVARGRKFRPRAYTIQLNSDQQRSITEMIEKLQQDSSADKKQTIVKSILSTLSSGLSSATLSAERMARSPFLAISSVIRTLTIAAQNDPIGALLEKPQLLNDFLGTLLKNQSAIKSIISALTIDDPQKDLLKQLVTTLCQENGKALTGYVSTVIEQLNNDKSLEVDVLVKELISSRPDLKEAINTLKEGLENATDTTAFLKAALSHTEVSTCLLVRWAVQPKLFSFLVSTITNLDSNLLSQVVRTMLPDEQAITGEITRLEERGLDGTSRVPGLTDSPVSVIGSLEPKIAYVSRDDVVTRDEWNSCYQAVLRYRTEIKTYSELTDKIRLQIWSDVYGVEGGGIGRRYSMENVDDGDGVDATTKNPTPYLTLKMLKKLEATQCSTNDDVQRKLSTMLPPSKDADVAIKLFDMLPSDWLIERKCRIYRDKDSETPNRVSHIPEKSVLLRAFDAVVASALRLLPLMRIQMKFSRHTFKTCCGVISKKRKNTIQGYHYQMC